MALSSIDLFAGIIGTNELIVARSGTAGNLLSNQWEIEMNVIKVISGMDSIRRSDPPMLAATVDGSFVIRRPRDSASACTSIQPLSQPPLSAKMDFPHLAFQLNLLIQFNSINK